MRGTLALAAVLSVLAIFAVWANRQLLDTSYWTDTSTKLLENGAVQHELSGYLTDQLYARVDVAGELRAGLPKQLRPLAGPAAGGLRNVVEEGVLLALQSQRVQELWRGANVVAHKQFVSLIENRGKVIRAPGRGAVVLDLRPIVADLAKRLGTPASITEKIPANVAEIKLVDSKALYTMQTAARVLRGFAIALPVLVLLLFAAAIGLSRGRRSHALVNIGLVAIGAGLLTLIARSIVGKQVVDTLASTEAARPAARAVWSIGTSVLVDVAGAAIFIGVLVVLAGLFGGRSRWATATRRSLAPYLRDRAGVAFGVAGVALLILFAWGPIAATQRLSGILLITSLSLLGVEMLRRQTAAEFPGLHYVGEIDGAHRRLVEARDSLARGSAHMRTALAGRIGGGVRPGGVETDSVERLERLAALHSSGALTDDEFSAAKDELLSR